jgi:predicted transcriptional regulator of viral defense system
MKKVSKKKPTPNWDRLFEIAAAQEGYFTTIQASEAGYYPQLLAKHLKSKRIMRVRRGAYRLVHFPAGEHEDLIVIWLWTERVAVFSHETALALHGLSDVLSSKAHATLPNSWKNRRLRVPPGVVLHFADIGHAERTWFGAVPVTTVARTLVDCADDNVAPEFVRDAFEDAADRGFVDRNSLPSVISYLKQFFSVSRSRSGPRFRSTSGWMPRSGK